MKVVYKTGKFEFEITLDPIHFEIGYVGLGKIARDLALAGF